MNLSKIIPLVNTRELAQLKTFYTVHFGFTVTFDGKGYLGLKSRAPESLEIGFMMPEPDCVSVFDGKGLSLCLQVEDVDGEYARLTNEGLAPMGPPTDNPWGDRSFMVADPAGVILYIHKPIRPAPEFEACIKE